MAILESNEANEIGQETEIDEGTEVAEIKTSRRQVREAIINLLYRHYVMNHDALTSRQELLDNFQANVSENDISRYESLFAGIDKYESIIGDHLKSDWRFSRLNNYEKAVLIDGAYEILKLQVDKKIVINELMTIVQQYATNEDYKYINKILDMIA